MKRKVEKEEEKKEEEEGTENKGKVEAEGVRGKRIIRIGRVAITMRRKGKEWRKRSKRTARNCYLQKKKQKKHIL